MANEINNNPLINDNPAIDNKKDPDNKDSNKKSTWIVILGICAGLFTTLAFLPQSIVSFKHNVAPKITLLTLISAILGNFLWFIYSFEVKDYILSTFSIIAVAIFTMLLFQKYLLPQEPSCA